MTEIAKQKHYIGSFITGKRKSEYSNDTTLYMVYLIKLEKAWY